MATPRVKRAFAGASSDPAQRQITNFFGRDLDYGADPSASSRPGFERRSSSPLLPPSVQANLLAVGMRVRKSVPEGYKTGKEEDEAAPRQKAAMATTYAAPQSSYSPFNAPKVAPSLTRSASASQRELTPFCGLHKIGGLGVQSFDDDDGRPLFAASLFNGSSDDDNLGNGSEPPSLTSSQDTVSSSSSAAFSSRFLSTPTTRFNTGTASSFASTRKRFYGQEDEDEDDCDHGYGNGNGTQDDAGAVYRSNNGRPFQVHEDARLPATQGLSRTSPSSFSSAPSFSFPVNGWLTSGNAGRRVLAIPRRRQKNGEQPPQRPAMKPADGSLLILDQENVEIMGDFGEADFLDANMLAQSGDMEMGGM
ncbi:hypothetical protein SCUCBS95973_000368 [Sporothrix curviconia]|uniref:Uncharacterized protein n=1 Tax=Sporothrix curviconia TaxID=1260050 RepID=A0ABP0APS9_9PEZI